MTQAPVTDVFDANYERFWRNDRSADDHRREIDMIVALGELTAGAKVLDLACAFGRLSNPLAARGFQVTGLDLSEQLLAVAAEQTPPGTRSPRFRRADFREPHFRDEFDLVLCWSTVLGYTTEADDRRVLAAALQSLKPGGRLLVETRHWDAMTRAFEPVTLRTSGSDLLVERHSYDPESGRQLTDQLLLVDGRRIERSYHLRRYGFPEMRSMCEQAGFVAVRGLDEQHRPLRADSRRCVLVARKPAGSEVTG